MVIYNKEKHLSQICLYTHKGFVTCVVLLLDFIFISLQCRPPGIYKQDYLNELFKRYGEEDETPEAPALPDWCTGNFC